LYFFIFFRVVVVYERPRANSGLLSLCAHVVNRTTATAATRTTL